MYPIVEPLCEDPIDGERERERDRAGSLLVPPGSVAVLAGKAEDEPERCRERERGRGGGAEGGGGTEERDRCVSDKEE